MKAQNKGRGWPARLLLTLATAAFLVLPSAAAQAHDALESSDPANGATIQSVPAKIGLTFDRTPIAINSIVRVEDSTGTDQADGAVDIVDNHVTQAVKAGAPAGKYTVVWRVVSSDGHPIEGTFSFTANSAATAGTAAAGTAGSGGSSGATSDAPTTAAPAQAGTAVGQVPWALVGGIAGVLVLALVVTGIFVRRRLQNADPEQ
ncbi:copper resistance CopC family protein [Arthrobacter sp. FW306-06-A]|uniref:copper resistance CopC family protein n=1 Tax=Arthrobacter sp. FW306-06-A TaxID=2879621 RepID=UPI001F259D70|nr:copper resistance CopC family protein [Arthrobacter sp. FW306-06-A]UKA70250.1 copper resistance protein CopC [Arthrobacter sp. FW306-06-A]